MKCSFCSHAVLENIDFPFPSFRHSDFQIVSSSFSLMQCQNCQLVFNNTTKSVNDEVERIYKEDEYFNVKKTHYISFDESEKNEVVTVYKARANFLKRHFLTQNPAILDIGCLDGKMLLEFEPLFENATFHGFDLNPKIESIFPKKKNFYFWSEMLSNIQPKFDAIIVSNVIQFVPDMKFFVDELKRLLKPSGFVFIEVTDFSVNPYTLLYGDQICYFSSIILENIFKLHGLEFNASGGGWAKRNVAGIAKIESKNTNIEFKQEKSFSTALNYFKDLQKKIKTIKHGTKIGVLGSTVNAAFINFLLKDDVSFFVDENIYRIGKDFYGKPIIHPSYLQESDLVIIPYEKTSEQIKNKLMGKYKGRFLCV